MIVELQIAIADFLRAKAEGDEPFSQEIDVQAAFLPEEDLSKVSGVHAYVVPSSTEDEILTRNSEESTISVDVAVSKRLEAADRTSQAWRDELAGMIGLVEEIARSLRFKNAGDAMWKSSGISPLYDPKRLRDANVFLSVVRLSY